MLVNPQLMLAAQHAQGVEALCVQLVPAEVEPHPPAGVQQPHLAEAVLYASLVDSLQSPPQTKNLKMEKRHTYKQYTVVPEGDNFLLLDVIAAASFMLARV